MRAVFVLLLLPMGLFAKEKLIADALEDEPFAKEVLERSITEREARQEKLAEQELLLSITDDRLEEDTPPKDKRRSLASN